MEEYYVNDEALEVEDAIQHLYRNGMFTDVTLIYGPEGKIYAHKIILAMFSPVLSNIFFGRNQSNCHEFHVEGFESSAVTNMIRYIYGEPLIFSNIYHVKETKEIAEKYEISGLRNACKKQVREAAIEVSNVLLVLEMAVEYENDSKGRECLELISQNQEAVFSSETFIKMTFDSVLEVFEKLRKTGSFSEVQYLHSALSWLGPKSDDSNKDKLMQRIQISKLCQDEFIDIITSFPKFFTNIEIADAFKEIRSAQQTKHESVENHLEASEDPTEPEGNIKIKSTDVTSSDEQAELEKVKDSAIVKAFDAWEDEICGNKKDSEQPSMGTSHTPSMIIPANEFVLNCCYKWLHGEKNFKRVMVEEARKYFG